MTGLIAYIIVRTYIIHSHRYNATDMKQAHILPILGHFMYTNIANYSNSLT